MGLDKERKRVLLRGRERLRGSRKRERWLSELLRQSSTMAMKEKGNQGSGKRRERKSVPYWATWHNPTGHLNIFLKFEFHLNFPKIQN